MSTATTFDLAGFSRATEACQYPDGTNALCSCDAERRDGLIAKQSVVQVWGE